MSHVWDEARPRDLLEEIEISPITRWRRYSVWPSRLLAQVLVLITALCHVWELEFVLGGFSKNFERNCFNLIFTGSLQHDEFSRQGGFNFDAEDFHANEFVVFNSSDAQNQLVNVVKNYFALTEASLDHVVVATPNGEVPFPKLHFKAKGERDLEEWFEVRSINDLGPLAPNQTVSNVTSFMHRLRVMELSLSVQSNNPHQWYLTRDSCVLWEYHFSYHRERGAGPFFASIRQHNQQRCNRSISGGFFKPVVWMHAWLFFTCLVHGSFAIARVLRGLNVLRILKRAIEVHEQRCQALDGSWEPEEAAETQLQPLRHRLFREGSTATCNTSASAASTLVGWHEINFTDKLTIVNKWNLISIAADLLLAAYTCVQGFELFGGQYTLLGEDDTGWLSGTIRALLGAGCGMHLFSMLEYAEYSLVDYLFLQVNRAARSEVFKIIVGILPVTLGYVVFGVVLYGGSVSRFGSFTATAVTLFGVCLGDEIWPTFMDLLSTPSVPSEVTVLYLVSFVFIHLNVVAMSVLAVVEEAFITQGLWLLDEHAESERSTGEPPVKVRVANVTPRHGSQGSRTSGGTATNAVSNESSPRRGPVRHASGVALQVSQQAAQLLQATSWRDEDRQPGIEEETNEELLETEKVDEQVLLSSDGENRSPT